MIDMNTTHQKHDRQLANYIYTIDRKLAEHASKGFGLENKDVRLLLIRKANILHKTINNPEAIKILETLNSTDYSTEETLRLEYLYKHYESGYLPSVFRRIVEKWRKKFNCAPLTDKKFPRLSAANLNTTPLVVGFISSNFKLHPVGWMTTGLFCELKHSHPKEVEFHIFNTSPSNDFISETIKQVSSPKHYDVSSLSDEELASFIDSQGLDYLIDLDGFSLSNRIGAVLKQRATIVKWVGGLIGSTYLEEVEFLITDSTQTPSVLHSDFTENLILFDNSYITYTPPPYKLKIQPVPSDSSEITTFGCFNNASKIGKDTINVWSEILTKMPSAILLLKDRAFDQSMARNNLLKEFRNNGIAESRITLLGESSHPEHLAAHGLVDICLDPIPYSGGLSTLESLYMGVPVVTMPGRLLAHRHSASHLNNIGCPELICMSPYQYVQTAVDLAKNMERLHFYRSNLRDKLYSSCLLDHKAFCDQFIKRLTTLTDS
jgi:predicted O-linked N-acetylglucosamine transferase (SPINDLY family)